MTETKYEDLVPEALLTAEEVAAWLKLPISWIYTAARQNRIPSVKAGRWVRFQRPQVQAWIDGGGLRRAEL